MNKSLALLLIVIGGLLTFPPALAAWEDRVLIDESGFVDLGNKVLSRPEIQQELAKEITKDVSGLLGSNIFGGAGGLLGGSGGLLGGIPGANDLSGLLGSVLGGSPNARATPGINDLGGLLGSLLGEPPTARPTPAPANPGPKVAAPSVLEPLIQPIALEAVSSLPNSEIANTALELAHVSALAAVRSKTLRPEKDAIVLDLGPEVGDILKELEITGAPPAGGDAGKIVLLDPTDLAAVFRLARFLDGKTMVLTLLPLAAFAAALVLMPDRRLFPAYAGVAIAASAALWMLIAMGPLKSWVTDRVAHDASELRVANAAYDEIVGSFISQELLILGVGVGLALLGALFVSMSRQSRPAAARNA